jgi:hypothetical protein
MRKLFVIATAVMFLFAIPMIALADSNHATATSGSSANGYNNGQNQGQDQGQTQMQGVGLNDVGNIKDSFNSQGMRGFAIPGEIMYGPLLNYYQQGTASGSFQRIENLILYSNVFTEGSLESILSGIDHVKAEMKVAADVAPAKPAKQDGATRFIMVVVTMPDQSGNVAKLDNVKFKGFVNAWSRDQYTAMPEVMAAAALEALKAGCNVIQFTAQGASRDTVSSGWGVGISATSVSVSGSQSSSTTGTAGIGYSAGQAGMRDKPWLQAFGLVAPEMDYPGDLTAAAMPAGKPQTGNHTKYGSAQAKK